MPSFSKREQAFEARFAHDEEFRRLATARRDKLFANWVAEGSELDGPARTALMALILEVAGGACHDERVIEMVDLTLSSSGRPMDRDKLIRALDDCGIEARRQLMAKAD